MSVRAIATDDRGWWSERVPSAVKWTFSVLSTLTLRNTLAPSTTSAPTSAPTSLCPPPLIYPCLHAQIPPDPRTSQDEVVTGLGRGGEGAVAGARLAHLAPEVRD